MRKTDIFDNPEFVEWYDDRPPAIQKVIREYPPDKTYKLHDGPFDVTIYSYDEELDGKVSLSVDVPSPFVARRVFGVKPIDLVEVLVEAIR